MTSTRLADRIQEVLRESPGLKASQIAERLGVERRDVNSVFYGELKPKYLVAQDSAYRWYLVEDAPKEAAVEEEIPSTPLAKLCRYYLDCLTHDDSDGVSVFATSKFDLDYCELTSWPFADGAAPPFAREDARSLLGRARGSRFKKTLFLGYPVLVRRLDKGSQTYTFVEPLFLFSCESDPEDRHAVPTFQGDLPWFNLKALASLPTESGDRPLQESIHLSEVLGTDRQGINPEEFDEVVRRLRSERAEWPWIEHPDPYDLVAEPSLFEVSQPGLYNRAVLVLGERSKYTWGLETELNKLMRLEEEEYADTALGHWLTGKEFASPPPPNEPLLEVLPLNTEQRAATQQGLYNELTVVTGPPGTGKSQVVTSLLANAAWRGTKVLFASRNNKAVDVVEERVNALGPRPILLRLGSTDYQRELAEYLSALLSATTTRTDEARYEEAQEQLQRVRTKFQLLEEQLQRVIALRNRTDELEQSAEVARELFGEKRFRSFKEHELAGLRRAAKEVESAVARSARQEQSALIRFFWPLLRKERFNALADVADRSAEALARLWLAAPDTPPSDETLGSWTELAQEADRRLKLAAQAKAYFKSLEELREAEPLEQLERDQYELITELSSVSREVWRRWLSLQPSRLKQQDRRLLGEYAAQIRLLVSAAESSSRAGSHVYRRYYELFPQVARFLPCWAVTNLTARRIPFQSGFFDVVVVDEASQCDIASALPLLYRSRRAVVIGDPKQLKHITGISEKQDHTLLEKHELIEGHLLWSYSVNSLYDLASHLCRSEDVVALRDHHRSHADIIRFSNEHFYEGDLRVATRYDRLRLLDGEPAVRWQHVEGTVTRPGGRGALNVTEAEAVVSELEGVVLGQGYRGTVGVVTPFRAHANRIRDLVARNDDLTRALSSREFIPDTAHAFQGDERDLIIFSPVVSRGISDGALWFLKNNGYLFNVAITRARGALIVVGNRNAARQSGVSYLAKFAEYASQVERQGLTRAGDGRESIDVSSLGPEYPAVRNPERVSDWERLLYRALYEEGIRTIPQYSVEKYHLDLALIDGNRRLDIEVDGERYHRRWDGELLRRDQLRNARLIELGWDVMRFWVYEIRDSLDSSVARVRSWLESAAHSA